MLEIGLTGGIGSGKSTVAQGLIARGCVLVDADAIVRELQEPGMPVVLAMAAEFGDGILHDDGALNRQAVADIVFSDPEALKKLNSIVHPVVRKEMTARRQAYVDTDETVILDIPLLVESQHKPTGGVIVVDLPVDLAVARLVEFRGFDETDARNRIESQVSREQRLERADFVIDNSGSLEALETELDRCRDWISTLDRPEPGTPIVEIKGRAEQ